VQLAILVLAKGNLHEIVGYVRAARADFRDVLWWSEIPAYDELPDDL
jgi:hypothetical protein